MVVDASTALAWCFEDEADANVDAVLEEVAANGAVVPPVWVPEVANALLVAERRGRITEAQSARFTSLLAELPIEIDPVASSPRDLLAVGRQHALTAYDAAYLALAEERGLPLATRDEALIAAASAAGVAVVGR